MNRPAEIRRPVNEARIGKPRASDFSARFSGRLILVRAFMLGVVATASLCPALTTSVGAAMVHTKEATYLPDAAASRVVTVARDGPADAGVTVLTEGVAIKETGPRATVKRFGEVYAFAPAFIAVHRDEPTMISFWNLQPDDEHDFMLADPQSTVLMHVLLPPLKETAYVFTFHREGLFTFYCTMHQPAMSGQLLVLPPRLP